MMFFSGQRNVDLRDDWYTAINYPRQNLLLYPEYWSQSEVRISLTWLN